MNGQAINIALGSAPIDRCDSVDVDGNRRVAINERVAAVGAALEVVVEGP